MIVEATFKGEKVKLERFCSRYTGKNPYQSKADRNKVIVQMYQDGKTQKEIGDIFGVWSKTISDVIRKYRNNP